MSGKRQRQCLPPLSINRSGNTGGNRALDDQADIGRLTAI